MNDERQFADYVVACDHCGTTSEWVMPCCANDHVRLCQGCYLRMVKVESGDPIHCPMRDYEVTHNG